MGVVQLEATVPAPDKLVLISESHEIHQAKWARAVAPVTLMEVEAVL